MTRYAVPCFTIAFCLLAYWLSTQFDRVPPILLRGMQPEDFPQMVLLIIAALSVLVIIFEKPVENEPVGVNVWTSLGLFAVFALLSQIDLFLGLGIFAGALAWAWGERTIAACNMPGATTSAPNFALPVTLSIPSGRFTRVPTTLKFSTFTSSKAILRRLSEVSRSIHHCANDFVISRATTQVALQSDFHLRHTGPFARSQYNRFNHAKIQNSSWRRDA